MDDATGAGKFAYEDAAIVTFVDSVADLQLWAVEGQGGVSTDEVEFRAMLAEGLEVINGFSFVYHHDRHLSAVVLAGVDEDVVGARGKTGGEVLGGVTDFETSDIEFAIEGVTSFAETLKYNVHIR